MRILNRGTAVALAGAAAVAGTFVAGGPAMAASTPIGACGGGSYHVIDSHDLGKATVYLLYNGKTNCVVTWKDSPNGTFINAVVGVTLNQFQDPGYYSTYAGPVKVAAAGQCIIWGGDYHDVTWTSSRSHCG